MHRFLWPGRGTIDEHDSVVRLLKVALVFSVLFKARKGSSGKELGYIYNNNMTLTTSNTQQLPNRNAIGPEN